MQASTEGGMVIGAAERSAIMTVLRCLIYKMKCKRAPKAGWLSAQQQMQRLTSLNAKTG